MDIHGYEARRTPNNLNAKRSSLRCIILKLSKSRQRKMLKAAKGKKIMAMYTESPLGYQQIFQQQHWMGKIRQQSCIFKTEGK